MYDDLPGAVRRGLLALGLGLLAGGTTLACTGTDDSDRAGQGAEAGEIAEDSVRQGTRPGPLRAVDRAREVSDSMASRAARMDTAG